MRKTFAALGLAAALAAAPAAAQGGTAAPILQAGFVGTVRPALTAGVRWTYTPPPGEPRMDENGDPVPVPAALSLQLLASAGVTFAEPRGQPVDFTALGSAALLIPHASGPVRGWGPALMGSFRPDAVGPGVRVETSFGALGAQAGVLWPLRGGDPSAAVTVDLSAAFLCDVVGC